MGIDRKRNLYQFVSLAKKGETLKKKNDTIAGILLSSMYSIVTTKISTSGLFA